MVGSYAGATCAQVQPRRSGRGELLGIELDLAPPALSGWGLALLMAAMTCSNDGGNNHRAFATGVSCGARDASHQDGVAAGARHRRVSFGYLRCPRCAAWMACQHCARAAERKKCGVANKLYKLLPHRGDVGTNYYICMIAPAHRYKTTAC